MPSLEQPAATSASTSRSRGVNLAMPLAEVGTLRRSGGELFTTTGRDRAMNVVHLRCTRASRGTVARDGDTSQRGASPMSFPICRAGFWLIPAWTMLALAPAAARAQWLIEPIGASEGIRELHDLGFDAQGRALLSW